MLYWHNEIKHLDIPMPRTVFCDIASSVEWIKLLGNYVGYPFFLRTDLCSGKHDWNGSCFVTNSVSIKEHMDKVLESNIRWQMLGIEPQAFVVREFLQLETLFTAFNGNMPINRERRYFVKDGTVVCSHPYWPVTAFNNHPARMANDLDWESKLAKLNERDSTEIILDKYTEQIGKQLGGFWSVDFARDIFGKWWLIDMALGENSYHYPHEVK